MGWREYHQNKFKAHTNGLLLLSEEYELTKKVTTTISDLADKARTGLVTEILELMLSGVPKNQVMSYISESFGVSFSVAQQLMDQCFILLLDDVEEEVKNQRQLAIMRRLQLYRGALGEGNIELALKILQDKDKMQGLYQTVSGMSEDALDKLINALNFHATEVQLENCNTDSTINCEL